MAAERKAKLLEPPSESDEEFSDEDLSDDDIDEVKGGEKKNYQEYSDVSEGEEVGASSDEEAVKRQKKSSKMQQGEDAEAAYLARLGKRKAREQYQTEVERQKRINAKLPVRKLDGEMSDNSSDEVDDQDDQEDDGEFRQESESQGLGSDDEPATTSRAVHAPLPALSDSEDDLAPPPATHPTVPLSSITHSSRFNLTAPYELLLTSHPCRLPTPPPRSNRKGATSAHKSLLVAASKQTLLLARNQIASLASSIVADPEVNLGLLKRLLVFAAPTVSAPPEKIPEIRAEQVAARKGFRQRGSTDQGGGAGGGAAVGDSFDARLVCRYFTGIQDSTADGQGEGGKSGSGSG